MAEATHEMAPHHLPPFIVAPGETDLLFVFLVCFMIAVVLLIGNFYFKLHALPEKMAHSANSAQLQLVGVLALLAMFTHNNVFWIAALLLAAFRIPDFSTPLNAMAQSIGDLVERIDRSGAFRAEAAPEPSEEQPASEPRAPAPPVSELPSSASPAEPSEPATSVTSTEVERKEAGDA